MKSLFSYLYHGQLGRILRARARLFFCIFIGVIVIFLLPASLVQHQVTRLVIAWNSGAYLYLLLSFLMMSRATHAHMKSHALAQDEGRFLILALVVIAAIVSLGAIVIELATAKDLQGSLRYMHVILVVLTILSSWFFTQIMFALHYAHDYYAAQMRGQTPGLSFPGEHAPDYGDFFYFACVIGTSGQTADVSFTSRSMRRTGTIHCVLAFFFNTTLVALMINIASGLI